HRLAPPGLQLVADDARKHVIAAAAGEGDDDLDRMRGDEGLRERDARNRRREQADDACCNPALHCTPPEPISVVMAGLVPAIPVRLAPCQTIGIAGTSPAMTAVGWLDLHINSADSVRRTPAGSGPVPAAPRRRSRPGSCRR